MTARPDATPPPAAPRTAASRTTGPQPIVAPHDAARRHPGRPGASQPASPAEILAAASGPGPLAGLRIALSISDGGDRSILGVDGAQQERLWARLASALITAGAELAYGGDLREGGYTRQLARLVEEAQAAGAQLPDGVIHDYLGWPLALAADTAGLPSAIRVHPLPMPHGLPRDPDRYVPPDSAVPDDHVAWALAMREMRIAMSRDCAARILVGGALHGVGPLPGVVEELLLDVGTRPIYLVGAFGGATRLLIRALLGDDPVELSEAFQRDGGRRSPIIAAWNAVAARRADLGRVDYEALVARLHELGVASLDNGLTDEENGRLFWSSDPFEITALILAGLERRLGAPRAP